MERGLPRTLYVCRDLQETDAGVDGVQQPSTARVPGLDLGYYSDTDSDRPPSLVSRSSDGRRQEADLLVGSDSDLSLIHI